MTVSASFEDRRERLRTLTPLEQDELRRIIGEAALDLWLHGEEWPDLVERCLSAIEEDAQAGWIPVVRHTPGPTALRDGPVSFL
jgi:DNA-binding MarR family transcriptional regulator